ncbi:hypothetical protein MNBD_ALPHA06-419 [hydrothermal vent metagenome]|uniref:Uncharacterized protein n=1 Tax=hydrothermal vent metagenome TaxID=652676 RepID=A0A3B0S5F9_9ZZZZ
MPKKTEKPEDVIDAEFEPIDEIKDKKPPRKRAAWPLVWSLFLFSILLGGALGAGLALIGMQKFSPKPSTDLSAITAQLETMQSQIKSRNQQISLFEQQIADLADRPVATNPDSAQMSLATEQLEQRLDALEARPILVSDATGEQTSVDLAPLLARITQLENSPAPVVDLSNYAKFSDLPETSPETSTALEARIVALENAPIITGTSQIDAEQLGTLEQRITALETRKDPSSTKARQAMALADLKLSAQGETPFAVAFAKARLQFTNSPALDQLSTIAGTGAPTVASLSQQLTEIIPLILSQANKPAKDASLATKAGAAMRSLVSVRRTDGKGEGLQAQLSIAERKMQTGDLAGAMQVLAQLDGTAAQVAAPWLQAAQNRQQINQSLLRLEQQQAKGDAP